MAESQTLEEQEEGGTVGLRVLTLDCLDLSKEDGGSEASQVGDCRGNLGRSWRLSAGAGTQARLVGGDGKLNRLGQGDASMALVGEGKLDRHGLENRVCLTH